MHGIIEHEGRFFRQANHKAYGARVTVRIQQSPGDATIHVDCSSSEWPTEPEWETGDRSGGAYALQALPEQRIAVDIIQIVGLITDTNPTIVAVAAIFAVWGGVGYQAPQPEIARLEGVALASWQHPYNFLPILGEQN